MLPRRILHARYIFPIVGDPIENGCVCIEAGRIVSVGKSPPHGEVVELGNAAILPGFVNAHTHLELSGLSRTDFQSVKESPTNLPLSKSRQVENLSYDFRQVTNLSYDLRQVGNQCCKVSFVDWIRQVIECRRSSGYDSAQAIADGLQECAASGVTAVGDIAQIDAGSCDFDAAPLNITNFFELIALTPDRIASAESFLRNEFSRRQTTATRTCGLSPHAPYTVHPELLKSIVSFSSQKSAPIAMHLAESREEMQLLAEGNGPIRDFLAERNLFDQATFPGGKRPLDYLKLLAGAARTLIIHGNYLDEEEIAFLAERNDRMGVVFCPRTHAFFAHPKYPLEKMLSAGVKVAFGTDSRASSPDLSLLGELRFAFRLYPQIGGEVILRMGTLDAAKILGREQEIGSLEPGKWANLAVVALPDTVTTSPDADLLSIETPVLQTWYQGTRIR